MSLRPLPATDVTTVVCFDSSFRHFVAWRRRHRFLAFCHGAPSMSWFAVLAEAKRRARA